MRIYIFRKKNQSVSLRHDLGRWAFHINKVLEEHNGKMREGYNEPTAYHAVNFPTCWGPLSVSWRSNWGNGRWEQTGRHSVLHLCECSYPEWKTFVCFLSSSSHTEVCRGTEVRILKN